MGWEVGGRFKNKGTKVYLWLILVDVWQKWTKHCKAIILPLKINLNLNKKIKQQQQQQQNGHDSSIVSRNAHWGDKMIKNARKSDFYRSQDSSYLSGKERAMTEWGHMDGDMDWVTQMVLLASSGCCNKVLAYTTNVLFPTILKAGKSKVRVPGWLGSDESPPTDSQMAVFFLCPYMAQSDHFSVSLLIRVLLPFMRTLPSWPDYLPRAPTPNTIL